MTGIYPAEKATKDFRAPIAIGALILLALYFWLTSRYPALNEKALMGGDAPLSGLSFDIVYEILPNSSLWWEILANTANWIKTNQKGMTFGVLFGAAALTVLATIRQRSFKNGFANSALGTAIGAPLGVCVNCAMPIALGLHMGRMRLETTLSALLASPTLNVIVITMSFALLPPHMAVLKLIFALTMVLLIVPLLCRFILKDEAAATGADPGTAVPKLAKISEPKGITGKFAKLLTHGTFEPGDYNIVAALIWFAKTYLRNFAIIFIITVPLMLAAAILGALVASFVSPTELTKLMPGRDLVMIALVTLAIVGVASFVPAPIAFDVILTVILINVGMHNHFAMATLIALGSFSVYPLLILGQAISWRTAFTMWIAVCGLAVTAAATEFVMAPRINDFYKERQIAALNSVDSIDWPTPPDAPEGIPIEELRERLAQYSAQPQTIAAAITTDGGSGVSLQSLSMPDRTPVSAQAGPAFTRVMGPEIGLEEIGESSPLREFGYHMMRGAVAGGDIHGDGWVDVITRRPDGANGLSVYANVDGQFVRQAVELGPVDEAEVHNLALADVDGDGALDLLVSTIMAGDHIFFNDSGTFTSGAMATFKEGGNDVVSSFGFADMDADGDLDIVLGKWGPRGIAEGWGLHPYHIRNLWMRNDGNRNFTTIEFEGIPGQTLSVLVADVDGNGYPDVLKGDDAAETDEVVFFNANGPVPTTPDNQPFDYFLRSAMSYDEGDWNNDLIPDYYGGQISMRAGMMPSSMSRVRNIRAICLQYRDDLGWDDAETEDCIVEELSIDSIRDGRSGKSGDSCLGPTLRRDQALCGAASQFGRYENVRRNPDGDRERFTACAAQMAHIPQIARLCNSLLEPTMGHLRSDDFAEFYAPALQTGNILQTGAPDGTFVDRGTEAGVRTPGWTWNSRLTDLDQDGWQDILVVTGFWHSAASSTTNVFYHNTGSGFEDGTNAFGFTDILPSYSYTSFDFDRDGDIDVIRDMNALRMVVHRNDNPAGPALWVNLRDSIGNSHGIGARVTICVDGVTEVAAGPCQMRRVKASGGYMSTDPIAAHFGLGDARSVSLIEVRWPDGETSRIEPEGLLGGEVVINRQ
ncbi:FG-GAP-like repeat-containing protein [Aurantiacibacter sp. MUD61]|uniref:FG-GAP-like repeat-containing protein n=1 Tax=Aurantiacibacter sp. MUD61 TaxID=3009083 RepID=UPI0022F0DD1F|nr:FG-GAP-like repeat-containing protein [Aurantiacibacter sp. MUD61]